MEGKKITRKYNQFTGSHISRNTIFMEQKFKARNLIFMGQM